MTAAVVRSAKILLGLAAAIAGAGFAAAMYLNQYAQASVVEDVSRRLQSHAIEEAAKIGALDAQGKRVEEDYHWMREQTARIADRVGAERVPAPQH